MKIKLERVVGKIALLAPVWLIILNLLYEYFGFSTKIFCALSIMIVLVCVICLVLDVVFVINKKNIRSLNKYYIMWAVFVSIVLFSFFLIGAFCNLE